MALGWTAIREARLQHKRLGRICGECISQSLDLILHVWHGPLSGTGFQKAHVAGEVLASIFVEIRVRRRQGNKVDDGTSQDAVDSVINASLHGQKANDAEIGVYALLQAAEKFGVVVASEHVLFPLSLRVIWLQACQLRPVQDDNAEVVMGVEVSNKV